MHITGKPGKHNINLEQITVIKNLGHEASVLINIGSPINARSLLNANVMKPVF